MPGGNKNIKPSDGVQFGKRNKAAEKWTEDAAIMLGDDLLNWMLAADGNIFFDEFLFIACDESKYPGKIYRDLLRYLSNKFSSFSERLEKAKEIEKLRLKKFGAFDRLNAGIVKFLLSAEYGLSEKKETEHIGNVSINIISKSDKLKENIDKI